MNTFGTLLLRIGRPSLFVPLVAIACQNAAPDEPRNKDSAAADPTENRNTISEPRTTLTTDPGSEPVDDATEASEEQHLLITLSYEDGVFKAERVTRVPGVLREPRSGNVQGKMAFMARAGSSTLLVAAAPDPRSVHLEYQEPGSQEMNSVSVLAPGKQYFLVHAPLATDVIDFFDNQRKVTPETSQLNESTGAADRGEQSLIGTASLEGLL
ncbi:MAG TPA: hypothetical protein VER96_36865 [Polyangiaceae bacterium]|nr:hypothetical protein [Polyangiaceae bacterium]